ncbi:hypothetical protein AMECASPLE_031798 [Ameca splendens]|uniref:Uncharacterized protein n=1 Tax=Ameca splendens TaxID=208324 RepID=A0ABV1ADM9_9TELE
MKNKDSSYLKASSFRSSSLDFGPSKIYFMTEETSQRDQVGGMEREFKRGEVLVKLFTHLATSASSPWRRLEIAGSLQEWLEVILGSTTPLRPSNKGPWEKSPHQ